ncbi:oxidoreductase [Oscillochloris sp. ZM17-4]|uniref:oxidoreductase n=1 Tax=Oscillochloris sp. ZM17-4 TaxID=2866714 RepID=UPI001C737C05|nr:oxidoreductase [Oscillochloris sp. ZM17-4]MBX0328005.1 oxidoreductase [Oscillochloris sp. ZM17-4]
MKTVLITGASSGIGKATAQKLLSEGGYTVYVAARRVEKMQDLAQQGAIPLAMDVTDDAQMVAAVERITKEQGGVDILINNAGFATYGAMEDTSIDDARYQFEVNIFGLARLTQLVLPSMRQKRAGTIVNISSVGGKIYTPLGAWYHATKHALEGWSDCLRLELAPFGINVVIVEPGLIKTEFDDVMIGPLLQRSGSSAYARMAQKVAKATQKNYASRTSSPPSVIADTIADALKARRPRTRYVAGAMARPILFLRRLLSDRLFDRLMGSMI